MEARVQKIIAQLGLASRREAEEMVRHSRVKVNGVLANLGQKVDLETDEISIDGETLGAKQRPGFIYLLLYKPAGVVSTCHDPQQRRTVLHLLPAELQHGLGIHPVGRLDLNSTGALLLTNDGGLTFGLTHPSHSITKTYDVLVKGHPPATVLRNWRDGVVIAGKKTRPAQVRLVECLTNQSRLEVILQEGRNRQIRLTAEQLGYPVIKLHRRAIGSIQLQTSTTNLQVGEYRFLTDDEVSFLNQQIGSCVPINKINQVSKGA
jgi:23S rRNA pseudouridine2605 synthase